MDEAQRVRDKALEASFEKEMVFRFYGDVEGVKCPVPSVEVHVDLLPPNTCRWYSETINGINMVGCLSVRFPEGKLPAIKVGKDKNIFKMNEDETFRNVLYKMVEQTLGHDDASSSVGVITLQWFSPVKEEE